MTPKGKKTAIVITSLLAIGSVVGYFVWKHRKNKKEEESLVAEQTTVTQDPSTTSTTPSTDGGKSPKVIVKTPTQVIGSGNGMPSSPSEIQKFQDWLDAKGLGWVGATNSSLTNGKPLKKGGGYGNFGSSTQKAWAIYGAEYLKLSAPKQTVTGSGFKKGEKLYPRLSFDNAYNYPSKDKKNIVGKVLRNGGNPSAIMLGDSSVKGWIKAKAVVTGYTFNQATKSYDTALKEVYLEAKNYTNVAP